jgi:putative intracellular protease/amidase
MPDMDLANVNPANYSAIVFVGGWGASSYQYAFSGTYANASYNGTAATKTRANQLINDFQSQGKYVTAICHGVSVLAWARVNNQSPLRGHSVAGYHGAAPQSSVAGATTSEWSIQQNGAQMFPSGSLGNPGTVADDVYVDGKIITAENFDTAARFGQVLAQQLLK